MTDGFWNLGDSLRLRHTNVVLSKPTKATPEGITTTARSATGVESCLGFQHSNWCSIDDRIRGRATTNATGSDDMAVKWVH